MHQAKYSGEFLLFFSWLTAFNPAMIPIILSCIASTLACVNYLLQIKKNRKP